MPSSHPVFRAAKRQRRAVLGLAVLSLVGVLGFVLAPVQRPHAVYSWPASPGNARPVAIPLMLLQPARLQATMSCAAVRAAASGTTLVSTTPLDPDSGAEQLSGLTVQVGKDGTLAIRTGGIDLAPQPVPDAGPCRWTILSTPASTMLVRDGRVVDVRAGDVRPAVSGVFSQAADPAGLAVDVTADTIFQTHPTAVKTVLGVVAVAALAAALAVFRRGEPVRGRGRRLARSALADERGATFLRLGSRVAEPAEGSDAAAGVPRTGGAHGRHPAAVRVLVDAAVVTVLAGWTVIGPMTIDDGYIAGIIRSRDANGYIGDVYRWFNAPEAPFGWNYEAMHAWAHISGTSVWMRIPSALLGVLTWLLLGRGLLPRLGTGSLRPGRYAVAALVFGIWWLPLNLGLRPEAWVAAGLAAVLVLVEQGLAHRRLTPVLLGLVVAGATLALTPTGAIAFLPILAAAVPLLRLARRRPGPGAPAALVTAAAASATGLLFMFANQSLAAVWLAGQIRAQLPGALSWSAEPQRWALLLTANDVQGPLERRVPVLLALLAVVGILWRRSRLSESGRPLVDRLLATSALSLVVLMFTPTKWTLHFGAFVANGAALIVVAMHLFAADRSSPGARHGRGRWSAVLSTGSLTATTAGLALVLLVAAESYAGWNSWAYLSNLDIPWNNAPPQLFGMRFSTVFVALSLLVAVLGAAVNIWARSTDRSEVRVPLGRWLPSPALVAVGLVEFTVALQLASFATATYQRRDTYTLAEDAAATVSGHPCGLAEDLRVETDPRAGLLPVADLAGLPDGVAALDGFTTVNDGETHAGPALRMAGQGLPGWSAIGHRAASGAGPAAARTAWYQLPRRVLDGSVPLVVTETGGGVAGTNVVAEFGVIRNDHVVPSGAVSFDNPTGPGARDARIDVSLTAPVPDVVRLILTDGGPDTTVPLSVSVPRAPVTQPFQQVVDPSQPALVDWPVAYVFPCQKLGVQADGVTDIPRWRVAAALPNVAGDIVVQSFVGGPYTAARSLVDQDEVSIYQRDRPLERPITLYAWHPRYPTVPTPREITMHTVPGWAR